ncbi:MAG: protein kinase [Kofleriaceae bacterium]
MVERVDPLVGSVLDNRYRIDFRIAAGGFGAIYRATHVRSNTQVALKVLHTELATNDARVIARFRREGATLAQLRDPHTITAYELGEDPTGPLYIVMELLHGESLYENFRAHGVLAWPRMVAIARMICNSLGEAHSLGIVHRDLKPANINLEKRDGNPDFVKVLDFGIAKIIRESEMDTMELTQAGQMIGTFDYMAPEQMVGGQCTARTDIYTLGVMVYEMIGGRRPFAEATSPTAMLASLLTQTPPPLSTLVRVPPELDRILMRCLEREPQNRYDDVAELAHDLDTLLIGSEEGLTRRMAATPPPVIIHDEVTVIDTRRSKRESEHPNVIRREGSQPAIKLSESGMRSKRESDHPNVVRREGSSPAIKADPTMRSKRESDHPNIIRRDGSQPPFEPRPLTTEPTTLRRDPAPAPVQRASQPVVDLRYVQPAPQAYPYGSQHAIQPPPVNPSAWPAAVAPIYPTAMPGSQSYDMAGNQNRDVMVRRIVWAVAILLGLALAIVVATRL